LLTLRAFRRRKAERKMPRNAFVVGLNMARFAAPTDRSATAISTRRGSASCPEPRAMANSHVIVKLPGLDERARCEVLAGAALRFFGVLFE
jgi:hypothetical protein